jgi:hypothetical protein
VSDTLPGEVQGLLRSRGPGPNEALRDTGGAVEVSAEICRRCPGRKAASYVKVRRTPAAEIRGMLAITDAWGRGGEG